MYNRPLREFVGGTTDELGGSYITGYVSNGPLNYACHTGDSKQVVNVKGFIFNCVVSQQLTLDVMNEMAISELITVTESRKIRNNLKNVKLARCHPQIFDKRVRDAHNHTSLPYGYA